MTPIANAEPARIVLRRKMNARHCGSMRARSMAAATPHAIRVLLRRPRTQAPRLVARLVVARVR
ncbi:hypothetical protein [Burkholderia pseudomallei]|uniref:hypothetical protein n=1 Tax=Burkholderia pseudomallei TaxID=28450 RepID=UPI0004AD1318|nr:hypothetical protein [Burkholderia pseudomallei]KAA8765386.1 hypothetical protein F5D26_23285 [Burkholderia pseudomallei]